MRQQTEKHHSKQKNNTANWKTPQQTEKHYSKQKNATANSENMNLQTIYKQAKRASERSERSARSAQDACIFFLMFNSSIIFCLNCCSISQSFLWFSKCTINQVNYNTFALPVHLSSQVSKSGCFAAEGSFFFDFCSAKTLKNLGFFGISIFSSFHCFRKVAILLQRGYKISFFLFFSG